MAKDKIFDVDWDGPSKIVVIEVNPVEDFVTISRCDSKGVPFQVNTDMNQMTITFRDFIQMTSNRSFL